MQSEDCKKNLPGAVGAVLSASNRPGNGEPEDRISEDWISEDGVIVEIGSFNVGW
jgi:hypothetical protein